MEVGERNFFAKEERLYLKKEINRLFESGLSFVSHPLRILYLSESNASESGVSILVSVPKKRFKQSVKRNRIKRLMRETYRSNSNTLKSVALQNGRKLQIALLYASNDLPTCGAMKTGMIKALKILENKILE